MRPCDDCRLCCKVFPVPALDKPAGAWCRHAAAGGCANHGPQKPEICRQYDCYWREHEALCESWRPDRIGIVVTEAGSVAAGDCLLPVVLFQEDFAEASRGDAARELLDHFVQRGVAVMIIHGLERGSSSIECIIRAFRLPTSRQRCGMSCRRMPRSSSGLEPSAPNTGH